MLPAMAVKVSKKTPCQNIEDALHQMYMKPVNHYTLDDRRLICCMCQQSIRIEIEPHCCLEFQDFVFVEDPRLPLQEVHGASYGVGCVHPKQAHIRLQAGDHIDPTPFSNAAFVATAFWAVTTKDQPTGSLIAKGRFDDSHVRYEDFHVGKE